MESIVNAFIIFFIVSLVAVVVFIRKKPEIQVEQDEIDDQVESIRSNFNVWTYFTRKEVVGILGWLILFALTLWFAYWILENSELVRMYINRFLNIPA